MAAMDRVPASTSPRIPLVVALAAGPAIIILARWPHIPEIAFNPYDLLVWGRGLGTDVMASVALWLAVRSVRKVWRDRRELLADLD
jgi:hypothetical protein